MYTTSKSTECFFLILKNSFEKGTDANFSAPHCALFKKQFFTVIAAICQLIFSCGSLKQINPDLQSLH